MPTFQVILAVVALLQNVYSLPTFTGYVNHPDTETGVRVAAWRAESGVNPEELGNYYQGDILRKEGQNTYNADVNANLWPGATVPYTIASSFSSSGVQRIQEAIAEYHSRTCIRFVQRTNERDYVSIENDDTGCYSYVGRIGGGQELNLQDGCLTTLGTPIHELLHALGFQHQQSSSDRDNYVDVLFQNIQIGKEHNFNKENTQDFGVSYDYGSVMHYSATAFSSNGQPTLVPKEAGASIGQRNGFSSKDIQKLNALYGC